MLSDFDWEDLGINWNEYHPNARQLLDDPFYWDCVNEWAPHGNDEGADVLELLKEWHGVSPDEFFAKLKESWQMNLDGDPQWAQDYRFVIIGMAFGYIKLEGSCPKSLQEQALAVIALEKQLIETNETYLNENERQERLAVLDLFSFKLLEIASKNDT